MWQPHFHFLFSVLFALVIQASPFAPGGRCGRQNGGATCDAQACCSYDGYCGFDERYCLASNGCQAQCTNGTATATSTSTPAASTSAAAKPSNSPLSKGMIIGIICAAVGLIALLGIGVFVYKCMKSKKDIQMQEKKMDHRERTMMMDLVDKHGPQVLSIMPAASTPRRQLGPALTESGHGRVTEVLD